VAVPSLTLRVTLLKHTFFFRYLDINKVRHDPEVQRAVSSYQLGLPHMPVAGRAGELLGRGTGTSLEFQEYRQYMPGDDIRHLDWAAYARSDTLMVRLYREEISPRTEILLDASKSMTSGGTIKPTVAKQLTTLFALLSGQLGGRPTIAILNDRQPIQTIRLDGLDLLTQLSFDARATLPQLLEAKQLPLKRQSVRIVVSDFLFPNDPESLLKRLASETSALWIIQLLNDWESDPTALGGRRLVDLETGAEIDMLINGKAIAEYSARLGRYQEELARNCRRVHANYVKLVADRGLAAVCRDDLCAAGILRPA